MLFWILILFSAAPLYAQQHVEDTGDVKQPHQHEALAEDEPQAREIEEDIDQKDDNETITIGIPSTMRLTGATSRIGARRLQEIGLTDIQKILQTQPGVYIRTEEGFGLRPNIGMRGTNSNRSDKLTLMEDGVLFGPAPYSAPAAYYFPLAIRAAGMDIFRGPAAMQFGPATVGGAINLKTHRIPSQGVDGAFDLAYGSYNTRKAYGRIAFAEKRFGMLIEGAHLGSDGFQTSSIDIDTGFKRTDLLGKLRLELPRHGLDEHHIELRYEHGRENSASTYLGMTAHEIENDPNGRYPTTANARFQWNRTGLRLTHRLSKASLHVENTLYRHTLRRIWTKINGIEGASSVHALLLQPPGFGRDRRTLDILRGDLLSTDPNEAIRLGTNDRSFISQGYRFKLERDFEGKGYHHVLKLGVRLHGDQVDRFETEVASFFDGQQLLPHENGRAVITDNLGQSTAASTYIQTQLRWNRIMLVPTLRHELIQNRFEDTDGVRPTTRRSILAPGVGMAYLFEKPLMIFAGIHRGFAPVSPGQAQDVQPERSWNTELGARYTKSTITLDGTLFMNRYENLLGNCGFSTGCVGSQAAQQFNGGAADIRGAEASIRHRVNISKATLTTRAAYTFTDAQFRNDFISGFPQFGRVQAGDLLPYIPRHQLSVNPTVKLNDIFVGLNYTMRSHMFDSASETEASIPTLSTLNMNLAYQINEKLSVYSNLENALNEQSIVSWRPFGARVNSPRMLMVGFRGEI